MNQNQFTKIEDKRPDENKHIIVTNNLSALNAHGEMSHVWMINNLIKSSSGEFVAFHADSKIMGITHWKYA
jgi:hypothetical protein